MVFHDNQLEDVGVGPVEVEEDGPFGRPPVRDLSRALAVAQRLAVHCHQAGAVFGQVKQQHLGTDLRRNAYPHDPVRRGRIADHGDREGTGVDRVCRRKGVACSARREVGLQQLGRVGRVPGAPRAERAHSRDSPRDARVGGVP